MNVFTRDRGIYQGRIAVASAPEGRFVYELGHARRVDAEVRVGDKHEVSQTFVMTPGSTYIAPAVVINTPGVLPVGSTWVVSAWLNGEEMIARRLRASKRILTMEDWRVSLRRANPAPATNTLTFRLELV